MPIVNPRDEQGVRDGEKQGGKGARAVAVNEGQTVSFAPAYTTVRPQSMMGLMALQCERLSFGVYLKITNLLKTKTEADQLNRVSLIGF